MEKEEIVSFFKKALMNIPLFSISDVGEVYGLSSGDSIEGDINMS